MTFSGASQDSRPDWIFPLEGDTLLLNHMGQNGHAYGGGIPISIVWTANECIALGSLSTVPLEISIPVERKGNTVTISIDPLAEKMPQLFIYKGKGDCFKVLQKYAAVLARKGIVPAGLSRSALETQWCGWGYGETFTPEEILATLPKVKEMGIEWVCVDDGFQTFRGGAADWKPSRFPESAMKELADAIHAEGREFFRARASGGGGHRFAWRPLASLACVRVRVAHSPARTRRGSRHSAPLPGGMGL